MKSGDARAARAGKRDRDEAQGSLEGLLPPQEPRAESESPDVAASPQSDMKRERKKPHLERPAEARERGADPLLESLDALEENVTLLLARLESLAADNAAAEERRRSGDSVDPVELEQRLRALTADKERIERHAAFLEHRIRGLLSRVRYVIES